jgi:hypothetical protein
VPTREHENVTDGAYAPSGRRLATGEVIGTFPGSHAPASRVGTRLPRDEVFTPSQRFFSLKVRDVSPDLAKGKGFPNGVQAPSGSRFRDTSSLSDTGMMKFPYGQSDFGKLMRDGYFYQDRSDRIPLLEAAGDQLLFIRPRRFGKSLLLSMLEH